MYLSTQLDDGVASLPNAVLTDENIHGNCYAAMVNFGLLERSPTPEITSFVRSIKHQTSRRDSKRRVNEADVRLDLITSLFAVWSTDCVQSPDLFYGRDTSLSVLIPLAPDAWSDLHVELIEAELHAFAVDAHYEHTNLLAALDALQ
jgi:hypothetical protein